jgi:antitoxin component YwqK of YwqJK toxin-antitoxin module
VDIQAHEEAEADRVEAGAVQASETYPTGGIRYEGQLIDGEMHGEWRFYRKDGSLMRSGSFVRGVQAGVWRTYDRSGGLVKETDFGPSGRPAGSATPTDPDGGRGAPA